MISYGSCINAAHRGGGWLQASHFLQELQEEGLRASDTCKHYDYYRWFVLMLVLVILLFMPYALSSEIVSLYTLSSNK